MPPSSASRCFSRSKKTSDYKAELNNHMKHCRMGNRSRDAREQAELVGNYPRILFISLPGAFMYK